MEVDLHALHILYIDGLMPERRYSIAGAGSYVFLALTHRYVPLAGMHNTMIFLIGPPCVSPGNVHSIAVAQTSDTYRPFHYWNCRRCPSSLQWRHNDHDGVPNYQPHDCLLNRLFRHRWKKTSKLRVTGLCVRGIHRWPVNSPHKGPVTRKMFPFDDVIMATSNWCHLFPLVQHHAARLSWQSP